MTQKFHKGDLVRVAKNLGFSMAHFTADVDAIVIGSYADEYGGGNTNSYTLHLKGQGKCSWYYENQLELIESNRLDLLEQWEREKVAEIKEKSDLDWIFAHGPEVAAAPHGASVARLAKCLGIEDMWGSHGEGFVWYENAMVTMAFAERFLKTSDKAGFMMECANILSLESHPPPSAERCKS